MILDSPSPLRLALRTMLVLAVLLLASCLLIFFGRGHDAVTMAQTRRAGVLTADEISVAFEVVGGRLVWRDIEESQQVAPGDTLMVLDDTDVVISVAGARAAVVTLEAQLAAEISQRDVASREADLLETTSWRQIEEAQAALRSAQAVKVFADQDFARAERLVRSGGVSQSTYDSARQAKTSADAAVTESAKRLASATVGADRASLDRLSSTGVAEGMPLLAVQVAREAVASREHTIDSLRGQLDSAKAELEQLLVNQRRLTLRAPEAGKILKILYEKGELVAPSAAAVLLETTRLYFDVYVSEEQAAALRPGDEIAVHAPALGRDLRGRVRFVTAAPSFADLRMTRERGQTDLTQFQVRVYLIEADGALSGMTMEVRL